MMQANLTDIDAPILRAVAAWVGMTPGDFLKLAGLALIDSLSGLYSAMSRDPNIRAQAKDAVDLRRLGKLDDLDLARELAELGAKDTGWEAQ
jgi:hypothetical protein